MNSVDWRCPIHPMQTMRGPLHSYATMECLDEIERLKGWLESIQACTEAREDWLLQSLHKMATEALNGDEVPS